MLASALMAFVDRMVLAGGLGGVSVALDVLYRCSAGRTRELTMFQGHRGLRRLVQASNSWNANGRGSSLHHKILRQHLLSLLVKQWSSLFSR